MKKGKLPKNILIIEDDEAILDALIIVLEKEDYAIESSANGKLLFNELFHKPDLILLDKQLCGIDGIEICQHIKKQVSTQNIPVILISAAPNLQNLAIEAGADDFIKKPFKIQEVRDKVRKFL